MDIAVTVIVLAMLIVLNVILLNFDKRLSGIERVLTQETIKQGEEINEGVLDAQNG